MSESRSDTSCIILYRTTGYQSPILCTCLPCAKSITTTLNLSDGQPEPGQGVRPELVDFLEPGTFVKEILVEFGLSNR